MLAYLSLKPMFDMLLDTGLVQKIYHSVIIDNRGDDRFPVYRVGDEWRFCGQDDTKIMGCYIRQTSDFTNIRTEQISSAEKLYYTRIGYRVVFFNDFEKRNHDQLAAILMNIVFDDNID